MPLKQQTVSLPIAGGVDTRTDERMVRAPKFAVLDNCVFDTPASVAQRNGFVKQNPFQTTEMITAKSLAPRQDELLVLDSVEGGVLLPFNGVARPSTPKRPRCSVKSGEAFNQIATPAFSSGASQYGPASIAHVPGFYVVCHSASSLNVVSFYTLDEATGSVIGAGVFSSEQGGQCFAFGDGILLLTVKSTSTALIGRVFQRSGKFISIGPPLTLVADLGANLAFDADDKGTGLIYLAYQSSTATTVKYGAVSIDGNYAQLGTQATAAEAVSVGVGVDGASGNFGIAWSMEAATNRVDARTYNAAGTALAAAATVSTGIGGGTTWRGVTCAFATSATLLVLFNHVTASTRSNVYLSSVNTLGAAGAPVGFSSASQLVSRAFVMPQYTFAAVFQQVFVVVGTVSALGQNSYYLCTAEFGGPDPQIGVMAEFAPGEYLSTYTAPHLSRPCIQGGIARFALMRSSAVTPFRLDSFTARFDDPDCQVSIQIGKAAFSPGGIVQAYDGLSLFEQGFLRFPEFGSAASSGTAGGLTPSTTYHYLVVFESLTATGELLQSAAVEDISGTTGGAATAITVNLPQFLLSNTAKPYFSVYRREQGGVAYHLCSTRNPTSTSYILATWIGLTTETVAFTDTMSEATLLSQELLPLSQGITDNIGPPACSIMAVGNSRVFLSGFDDPDLIWYSKLRETGQWLQFTDVNTIVIESGTGPISALGCIQDALVIFRPTEIYMCGGDGLDNTGTSGTFTTPRLISSGIGCTEPRSIITVGGALYFKSAKGFYVLDGQGQLSFVGSDVARYASEPTTSVVAPPNVNQIRWTTANRTLVLDYELARWTHWTIGALSSCMWQGKHTLLVDAAGTILSETPGVYADNGLPFPFIIETPWMTPAGPQGRMRLYEILVLGAFLATHQVKISLSFDYEVGRENEINYWDPNQVINRPEAGYGFGLYGANFYGGLNSSTGFENMTYEFSVSPTRQKCTAFKVRLEAQALEGANPLGAAFTLSEIDLVIGLRGGDAKLGIQRKAE